MTRLLAEDMDAPGSPNSHIVYQLLNPEPEEGADGRAFELDFTSGSVTLGDAPLRAGQNILLRVKAVDRGGAEDGKCPMVTQVLSLSVPFLVSPTCPLLPQASAARVRSLSQSQISMTMPPSSLFPR